MKTLLTIAISILVLGCAETETTDSLDSLYYEFSGLPASAYIGATAVDHGVDIVFEPSQATVSQISAAPEKVCGRFRASVLSVENKRHSNTTNYPTARVLEIRCTPG